MRAIFAIGALISAIWLGAAASYVQFRITWQSLLELPFVDLAAFVAAAFGPPAALWLIIGYVQLGSALRENNFALKQLHWQTKRAADQAEVEARTLVESRTSAKRAELFPLISYLIDELNPLVAHLAVELKLIDNAQYASAWQRFGQGDRWVFFRCILNTSGGPESLERKISVALKQDSKALPLAEEFRENFANLIKELRSVEGEGLITRLVERGNLGKLDLLLKRTMPRPEAAPAAPEPVFKPVGTPDPEPAPDPKPQSAPEPASRAVAEPEEEPELPPVPGGGWTAAVERPIPPAPTTPVVAAPRLTRERDPDPVSPPPKPAPEAAADPEEQPDSVMPRDPQRDEARRALAEIAAALQAVDEANGRETPEENARNQRPVPFPTRREPQLPPQRAPLGSANDTPKDTRPAPPTRPLLASQTLPREGSAFPTVNPATPRDTDRKPAAETTPPAASNRSQASDNEPLPPIPEGIRPKEETKRRLSPIVSGLFGNRPRDK
ncbi:MAG: hypothetical protein RIC36_04130 [Rhodospirillales bacterium]